MSDMGRLRKTTQSSLERALLDAGTGYRASSQTHARTLAALGIAMSVVASAGTSAASSSTPSLLGKLGWAKLGWTAKVAFTVSSLGTVVGVPAYFSWRHYAPNSSHTEVVASVPAHGLEAVPAVAEEVDDSTSPAVGVRDQARAREPGEPAVARPKPSGKSTPTTAPAQAPLGGGPMARSQGLLKGELDLIDAARSVSARGDHQDALAILDAYSRTYPRGRLQLEAEVLRIDALARSGQVATARRAAEDFLAKHPKGVLHTRVRAYLHD